MDNQWTVLVIIILCAESRRFRELKRGIEGIWQRMLTLTLRNLERLGLVDWTVRQSIPPRADYDLTALGRLFAEPVLALGDWAFGHLQEIETAEARCGEMNHPESERAKS